jgi:hypothetical protein
MEELQKIIECIQEGKCAVVELKKSVNLFYLSNVSWIFVSSCFN